MGIAIVILLPILFVVISVYVVLELTFLLLRLMFVPAAVVLALRRR